MEVFPLNIKHFEQNVQWKNEIINQVSELNICLQFLSLFYSSMFLNLNKLEKLYINRKIKLIMYTILVTKNFYYLISDIKHAL